MPSKKRYGKKKRTHEEVKVCEETGLRIQRTDELRTNSRRWERLISARMRWKQLRRTFLDDMWEAMGWDEKSWDEVRWGEKSSHDLRWDEVSSLKCEECSVKCEESLRLPLHCTGVAQVILDNNTATASHKARTHGLGWRTAHASSIDEKGLIYIYIYL